MIPVAGKQGEQGAAVERKQEKKEEADVETFRSLRSLFSPYVYNSISGPSAISLFFSLWYKVQTYHGEKKEDLRRPSSIYWPVTKIIGVTGVWSHKTLNL